MSGDFSRFTFNPKHNYSKVLMQQGRVILDADWNEMQSIMSHYAQLQVTDLIGEASYPNGNAAFNPPGKALKNNEQIEYKLTFDCAMENDIKKPSRVYVNGIIFEQTEAVELVIPENIISAASEAASSAEHYFYTYLDVQQRLVSAIDQPKLLEPGLMGADTADRIQNQITIKCSDLFTVAREGNAERVLGNQWYEFQQKHQSNGQLKVTKAEENLSLKSTLYRVQVAAVDVDKKILSIVYSDDNSAMAYGVNKNIAMQYNDNVQNGQENGQESNTGKISLLGLERNDRKLVVGCYFSLHDANNNIILNTANENTLFQVTQVDITANIVHFKGSYSSQDEEKKPIKLMQWKNIYNINKSCNQEDYQESLTIDSRLKLTFQKDQKYSVGDYWLIPTRASQTSLGAIANKWLPPFEVRTNYQPLACFKITKKNNLISINKYDDLRKIFYPATEMSDYLSLTRGGTVKASTTFTAGATFGKKGADSTITFGVDNNQDKTTRLTFNKDTKSTFSKGSTTTFNAESTTTFENTPEFANGAKFTKGADVTFTGEEQTLTFMDGAKISGTNIIGANEISDNSVTIAKLALEHGMCFLSTEKKIEGYINIGNMLPNQNGVLTLCEQTIPDSAKTKSTLLAVRVDDNESEENLEFFFNINDEACKNSIGAYGNNTLYVLDPVRDEKQEFSNYNVTTKQVMLHANFPKKISNINTALTNTTMCVVKEGNGDSVFFIGGANGSNKVYSLWLEYGKSSSEIKSEQVQTLASLPINSHSGTAIIVKGKLHYFGGNDSEDKVTADHYIYDIQSNHWLKGKSMPIAVSNAGIVTIDDKIICLGGKINSTEVTNTVQIYDTITKVWMESTYNSLTIARSHIQATVHQNTIYVCGGRDKAGKYVPKIEKAIYEVETDRPLYVHKKSNP